MGFGFGRRSMRIIGNGLVEDVRWGHQMRQVLEKRRGREARNLWMAVTSMQTGSIKGGIRIEMTRFLGHNSDPCFGPEKGVGLDTVVTPGCHSLWFGHPCDRRGAWKMLEKCRVGCGEGVTPSIEQVKIQEVDGGCGSRGEGCWLLRCRFTQCGK